MEYLWGRKVLKEECKGSFSVATQVFPAFQQLNHLKGKCFRCSTIIDKQRTMLPTGTYYCSNCIQLGRVTSDAYFYHLPEPPLQARAVLFNWQGNLTAGQQKVSAQLRQAVAKKAPHLIWAVTGAGKTEMLFATLHEKLQKGARIALASPRVDVCLELYPRIQAVFPKETIALLHGQQTAEYRYTKLVICTVHQLWRFYQAFDLLIVDEVDSFPFVNNRPLYYGVQQALKTSGSLVYLTATPTKELQVQIKKKLLGVSVLPARYHRRLLPVPNLMWCSHWQQVSHTHSLKKVLALIQRLIKQNKVLLFCPSIKLIKLLYEQLSTAFPQQSVEMVYGDDNARLEKVKAMRQEQVDLLITTTILERGVTFERVSVIVYGANHQVFSAAALVQIAGRVDRRWHYTEGEVWFLHSGRTQALNEAVQQIKHMNYLAKAEGLIDEV